MIMKPDAKNVEFLIFWTCYMIGVVMLIDWLWRTWL